MAWKKGPLPEGTWNWGGVVPADEGISGFYFADFRGDHAVINPGTPQERRLTAEQVGWYDDGLGMPPGSAKGRADH